MRGCLVCLGWLSVLRLGLGIVNLIRICVFRFCIRHWFMIYLIWISLFCNLSFIYNFNNRYKRTDLFERDHMHIFNKWVETVQWDKLKALENVNTSFSYIFYFYIWYILVFSIYLTLLEVGIIKNWLLNRGMDQNY